MDSRKNEFGSLFTGGGGLDLGLERAGLKCVFQVENDKHCITLLKRHWPDVPKNEIRPCVGLVGGDPCPIRSSLSSTSATSKPDLSGYFLAMVARIKPRWILRENVIAPDIVEFKAGLDLLRYHSVVIEINSASFTGQSRGRHFLVGFTSESTAKRFKVLLTKKLNTDTYKTLPKKQKAAQCLTTRGRGGVSIYQDFIYEAGPGLRCHTHAERESLQGWPIGWTDGLPHSARERITGNGVTAPVAEYIGELIVEANR